MTQINEQMVKTLAGRFDEAIDLIANEFQGLSIDQQYRNAFARLLKWDPLERVLMLGTDQRDLFVPELKQFLSENVPAVNGHVFDFGGGDGLTFELASSSVPPQSRVSFLDPNKKYVEQYEARIQRNDLLRQGDALSTSFDDVSELKSDVDAALAIHMIYFVENLEESIKKIYSALKPGGALFLVYAEESVAYTGCAARHYFSQLNKPDELLALQSLCQQRFDLLASEEEGGGQIVEVLDKSFPQFTATLTSELQGSRLYGHTLSDIIALANIAELASVDDLRKFATTKGLIESSPSVVDLRLEKTGTRAGMLSVSQPQRVVVVRKNEVVNGI